MKTWQQRNERKKGDERKENDVHQRKTESRKDVSDGVLFVSEAFIQAFILSCLL